MDKEKKLQNKELDKVTGGNDPVWAYRDYRALCMDFVAPVASNLEHPANVDLFDGENCSRYKKAFKSKIGLDRKCCGTCEYCCDTGNKFRCKAVSKEHPTYF